MSIALIAVVIVLAGFTTYFYGRALESEARYEELVAKLGEVSYKVDLLINFGNGTLRWYNDTYVPIGFSLFDLTVKVTDGEVGYTKGKFGIFVDSIYDVGKQPKKNYFWMWWRFDPEQRKWVLGEVGADQYILSAGEVLAWYYQDTSKFPNLEPPR